MSIPNPKLSWRPAKKKPSVMICQTCGANNIAVIDSRPSQMLVKRVRRCQSCNVRWTTYEVTASSLSGLPSAERMRDIASQFTALAELVDLINGATDV